jgi:hypothetical protein
MLQEWAAVVEPKSLLNILGKLRRKGGSISSNGTPDLPA